MSSEMDDQGQAELPGARIFPTLRRFREKVGVMTFFIRVVNKTKAQRGGPCCLSSRLPEARPENPEMPPRSPRKSAAPSTAMQGGGESESWVQQTKNQLRVADLFLKHINDTTSALATKWGDDWTKVPEEYAASEEIFGHLATFLVETYRIDKNSPIRAGEKLGKRSAVAIWSGLLQQNYKRFAKTQRQETRDFFRCLKADGSEEAAWYAQIKTKITRLIFQRQLSNAEVTCSC